MNLALLSILAILLFAPSAQSNHLSIGWDLWFPYQYHNEQRELVGLDVETLKAIMQKAELEFSFAEIPWKTNLHFLQTGKMDIAMGAYWSKERAKYAHFSAPYRHETVRLFFKTGTTKKIPLDSLAYLADSSYLIGVNSGAYYGSEYEELIKHTNFQRIFREGIELQQNVSLFLDDKLDGILVDPVAMQAFIEKYDMHNVFEQHPLKVYSANVHMMLSKKSLDKSILNKINQAILTLKKEGIIQKINQSKR